MIGVGKTLHLIHVNNSTKHAESIVNLVLISPRLSKHKLSSSPWPCAALAYAMIFLMTTTTDYTSYLFKFKSRCYVASVERALACALFEGQ